MNGCAELDPWSTMVVLRLQLAIISLFIFFCIFFMSYNEHVLLLQSENKRMFCKRTMNLKDNEGELVNQL